MNDKVNSFTPRATFVVKVGWPNIFPENRLNPFTFRMRIQLVGEAEKIQEEFFSLEQVEKTPGRTHEYDAAMISQLCTELPTGFPDLLAVDVDYTLADTIRDYLLGVDKDAEAKEALAMICRSVMSKYWQALMPADYL